MIIKTLKICDFLKRIGFKEKLNIFTLEIVIVQLAKFNFLFEFFQRGRGAHLEKGFFYQEAEAIVTILG